MNTNENRVAILNEMEAVRHQVHKELLHFPGYGYVYVFTSVCAPPFGKATFTVRADNVEDAFDKASEAAKEHPTALGDLELIASSRLQTWAISYCPQDNAGQVFKYFVTTYSAKHAYLELKDDLKLTDAVIGVRHVKEI